MSDSKKLRVLFVCLGNICRSPTADGVMRRLVVEHGLESKIDVDSAGTGGWHVGDPPDSRMQSHAKRRGYDLSVLKARKFVSDDFHEFDYVLAMDHSNFRDMKSIEPAGHTARFQLFGEYCRRDGDVPAVPDPYYGGAQGFETVLDMVEEGCGKLLETMKEQLKK